MPNCFTLTRKSEPEKGPVPFNLIDGEMCEHFKVPVHPKLYYEYWYDIYGFAVACGSTIREVIERHEEYPRIQAIGEWLDENFTTNAWAEIGK